MDHFVKQRDNEENHYGTVLYSYKWVLYVI